MIYSITYYDYRGRDETNWISATHLYRHTYLKLEAANFTLSLMMSLSPPTSDANMLDIGFADFSSLRTCRRMH